MVFKYLIENEKLSKIQGAFTPGRSTTGQLIEMYHVIVECMDKGKECRFIFCDVSKAFKTGYGTLGYSTNSKRREYKGNYKIGSRTISLTEPRE